jgi:hypothetical protein
MLSTDVTFSVIFSPRLVKSTDAEPAVMEGLLNTVM